MQEYIYRNFYITYDKRQKLWIAQNTSNNKRIVCKSYEDCIDEVNDYRLNEKQDDYRKYKYTSWL